MGGEGCHPSRSFSRDLSTPSLLRRGFRPPSTLSIAVSEQFPVAPWDSTTLFSWPPCARLFRQHSAVHARPLPVYRGCVHVVWPVLYSSLPSASPRYTACFSLTVLFQRLDATPCTADLAPGGGDGFPIIQIPLLPPWGLAVCLQSSDGCVSYSQLMRIVALVGLSPTSYP